MLSVYFAKSKKTNNTLFCKIGIIPNKIKYGRSGITCTHQRAF